MAVKLFRSDFCIVTGCGNTSAVAGVFCNACYVLLPQSLKRQVSSWYVRAQDHEHGARAKFKSVAWYAARVAANQLRLYRMKTLAGE